MGEVISQASDSSLSRELHAFNHSNYLVYIVKASASTALALPECFRSHFCYFFITGREPVLSAWKFSGKQSAARSSQPTVSLANVLRKTLTVYEQTL